MARPTNKLTVKFTEKQDLKPGLYGDGGGLYLQVSDFSTKAWVFRYMMAGRARKMGLGEVGPGGGKGGVSLNDARKKRDAAYGLVVDGIDPIEERKERKAVQRAKNAKLTTFGQAAEEYIAAHESSWKNEKHRDQWRMTLLGVTPKGEPAKHDYCKIIRDLPVDLIDGALVLKVLRPIWNDKTETASRLRGRIETILDYAKVALKLREGDNPARWEGNLKFSLPQKSKVSPSENHPALPYDQIAEFTKELRQRDGIAARALEFAILCAARTGEIIGARRSEIDRDKKIWTVPKDRMKGETGARKHDHVVPLSNRALAILEGLPGEGEYLFPLSNAAMGAVIDRINEDRAKAGLLKWVDPKLGGREVVPHGFRSTFKDWSSEETEYDNNLSEMALSHTLPDKVEAAYRRGSMVEKRRRLMADWAAYCDSKIVGGDNVVAIGDRR